MITLEKLSAAKKVLERQNVDQPYFAIFDGWMFKFGDVIEVKSLDEDEFLPWDDEHEGCKRLVEIFG